MIRGGIPGRVYRAPQRNRHGDPVDSDGNVVEMLDDGTCLVGEVKGLVMGWLSPSQQDDRAESSSGKTTIGVPNENTIHVQYGDRLLVDGVRYQVVSNGRWNYANSMTTTRPEYHWVDVTTWLG